MRNRRRWLVLASIVVVVVFVSLSVIAASYPVQWRAQIILAKATGRLADIGWSDLAWMLRPGSGVYLETLAKTHNPYEVIQSPRTSKSDLEAGQQLFLRDCSPCHGNNGHGGPGGPSLSDHAFRQGRSDWALYRTITMGIPGTAMAGRQLPRDDVWRLVSYLKSVFVTQDGGTASGGTPVKTLLVNPVTANELSSAEDRPSEWITYSGSYASHRYSRLSQINRENAKQLRVEWQRQFSTTEVKVENSPVVRGSTMFVTEPPNHVHALDAATGHVLWTYSHDLPVKLQLCCGTVNRGVALLGNLVYVGTLDAHLVALEASTGKIVWDVAVAEPSSGYSITGAPLAIDDMVVTGVAGGEYGMRGFVDAYDAATGKRRWRFYTVPTAGSAGSDTWAGDSFRSGGGPTWLTGSFDPDLRLIYWGVGNPSPNFYGENRKGDNLYTDSVIALDADSGQLRWYFQFTPHDLHDWDAAQIPILADAVLEGSKHKLLAWANRNGFYYLLDRTTGKFLLGAPYVKQTWASGLDGNGRPQVRSESVPNQKGSLVYPSVTGATNWWSPAYDPNLELVYVPTIDRPGMFFASPNQPLDEDGENLGGFSEMVPVDDIRVAVKAIKLTTGQVSWQYKPPSRKADGVVGGLLATAGGIVFGGDLESLFALDSQTGAELWHFETGGQVQAAPVTYELEGRQFVAVAAGRTILAFALPVSNSK